MNAPAEDTAIPPAIVLVRDFVNSVEWQLDEDSWRSPRDLEDWLLEHAAVSMRGLDVHDLALAKRLREGLRGVLLMHAGHDALASSVDDLNAALATIPLRMQFEADGTAGLAPDSPLAVILDAIETARNDGDWDRLKACSRDSCRWAYWDGSRNRSGRWCSMAGCGNYLKMRRRGGRDLEDGEVIADGTGSSRHPTLIDVAGRAGVSIKTVSNVVTGAGAVTAPTKARVEAAIDALGYRPNLAARALRTGSTTLDDGVDPYGLPTFPEEASLTEWADHSDIATRTVRVFTHRTLTVTLISHAGGWDLIASGGDGSVQFFFLQPAEIVPTMRRLETT